MRWTAIGVPAMLVLVSLLATSTAAGADAFRYPSATKAVPSTRPHEQGRGSLAAICPESHPRVTGGGVRIRGDNSGFGLSVGTTAPVNHRLDRWSAEANNTSGSPARMTVTAVCAKPAAFVYHSSVKTIHPGLQGTLKVRCPAGTQVTGGGVLTDVPSPRVQIASTRPFDGPDKNSTPDDGWLGAANNGTHRNVGLEVYAACAKSGHYNYVRSAPKPLPDNTQASAVANCPVGTSVTGGGVDNSGFEIGAGIESTFPVPDTGWEGRASNHATGRPATIQTFAICKVTETDFIGHFAEGGTVTFRLTKDRTKIHNWTWHGLPVQCREGGDENSGKYRFDLPVHHHHFQTPRPVKDPVEGFKTTLSGTLTSHSTVASGTFTMSGPENGPPLHHRCHGTGHWTASAL